jgi:hypothetical protein
VSLSLMLRAEFRQAHVVQFAARSAIYRATLQTIIFQQDAAVFEKQIQLAGTIHIQTVGNYRDVVLAPFAFHVHLAGVAIGIVELEIYTDLAFGRFSHPDRIVAGRGLSVDSKNALRGTGGRLAHHRKRTHYAQANPQTRCGASTALPHKKSPAETTSVPPVDACVYPTPYAVLVSMARVFVDQGAWHTQGAAENRNSQNHKRLCLIH